MSEKRIKEEQDNLKSISISDPPKRKVTSENNQISKKRKLNGEECEPNCEIKLEKQSSQLESNETVSQDNTTSGQNSDSQDEQKPINTFIEKFKPTSYNMECKPCGKKFTSSTPYFQHLNSKGHQKNFKGDNKTSWDCEICNKTFSGPIPYDQHLKSKLHDKTIKTLELTNKYGEAKSLKTSAEGQTEKKSVDNVSTHSSAKELSCEICQKNFTGPIPYDMHLVSKLHLKNVIKRVVTDEEQDDSGKIEEPELQALKKIQEDLQKKPEKDIASDCKPQV